MGWRFFGSCVARKTKTSSVSFIQLWDEKTSGPKMTPLCVLGEVDVSQLALLLVKLRSVSLDGITLLLNSSPCWEKESLKTVHRRSSQDVLVWPTKSAISRRRMVKHNVFNNSRQQQKNKRKHTWGSAKCHTNRISCFTNLKQILRKKRTQI